MTTTQNATVGERIRTLRQTKCWGLNELAEKTDLSKGYLSELERGEQDNPTIMVLHRIATALGTTIADLLGQPGIGPRSELPTSLPGPLLELVRERQRSRMPLDEVSVRWLASAQYRGARPQTKADFATLLHILQTMTGRKPR